MNVTASCEPYGCVECIVSIKITNTFFAWKGQYLSNVNSISISSSNIYQGFLTAKTAIEKRGNETFSGNGVIGLQIWSRKTPNDSRKKPKISEMEAFDQCLFAGMHDAL